MTLSDIPLFLVDAFAERAFAGNTAAVCLLDGPAENAWMQRVAAELGQAATAFVSPSGNGVLGLRWFTVTTELTLCGHGTLAAAHVLWERGEPSEILRFETASGPLTARREAGRVGLGFPAMPPWRVDPPDGLVDVLGGVEPSFTGRNDLDLFVELPSEAHVRSLAPDLRRLDALDARGLIVTAASSNPAFSFVSRYFAPKLGIPEDQATGSAHCALGPFWSERLHRDDLIGIQLSPRGGEVEVRLDVPGRVYLIGRAITMVRGTLQSTVQTERPEIAASPGSAGHRREGADPEALSDLATPWCIRVLVTLRIADHIAAGITDVEHLAAAAGCDTAALHNVLGHVVDRGVFEETAPGRFALNDAARALLDPGQRLGLDLEGIGGRMAHAWGSLLIYVRTGIPGYSEVFGLPFWEDLAAHPDVAASFDALMGPAGHGTPDADIPVTGGWESVRTVVDVGGGTGTMLAEILRTHPHIHGILVDFPGTVARSGETFQTAGVADRVTTVGQSFFDPLPAGADLYLLKKVLNDWPDRETVAILRRCAEAAGPSGRVVVLGGVSADDAPRRLAIEMILVGGKSNTVTEFRDLARQAGLEVSAAERQPSGRIVVECRPT
jgi:predicted PhzF superfamily epimerase YddE/YHI9